MTDDPTSEQYHSDFHAWALHQAAMLRAGLVLQADIMNIAEELEDMAGSKQDQLTNRLGVLLAHLLRWHYQPARRGRSWLATISEQRRRIDRLLRQNPSLKHKLPETFADASGDARLIAIRETDLPDETFPAGCPWSFDQAIMDDPT